MRGRREHRSAKIITDMTHQTTRNRHRRDPQDLPTLQHAMRNRPTENATVRAPYEGSPPKGFLERRGGSPSSEEKEANQFTSLFRGCHDNQQSPQNTFSVRLQCNLQLPPPPPPSALIPPATPFSLET